MKIETLKIVYHKANVVMIERFKPNDSVGKEIKLLKPQSLIEREAKSTSWGKVVKLSEEVLSDPDLCSFRDKIQVGTWVNFWASNPVSGGLPKEKEFQLIAVDDIFYAIDDESFEKYIRSEE